MSELNEKELLMLSNYAYFSCSKDYGTIGENIDKLKGENGEFDIDKLKMQGAISSNISEDEAIKLLTDIEKDDKLKNLSLRRATNDGGIRGLLYTDANDNATLVFRGTGGTYNAWNDNVMGEYETDTKLQTLARDFVKYECGEFKNITVTGHSKGGNLSQYVTVTCGDQIDRCVSYDGQGFGQKFLKEYKSEIEAAKNKITSISAYNDFVNILLFSIAGNTLYVKNNGILADAHSSYTLLASSLFDENGNFDRKKDTKEQSFLMKNIKKALDTTVTALDLLPNDGNEKSSNVLAALVSSVMSADKGTEYEEKKIEASLNAMKDYTKTMVGIMDTNSVCPPITYMYSQVSVDKLNVVYNELDNQKNKLLTMPEMIEDILVRLDYSIAARTVTEVSLKRIIAKTDKIIAMMNKYLDTLFVIIKGYEKLENDMIQVIKI